MDRRLAEIKRLCADLNSLDYLWATVEASSNLLQLLRMDPHRDGARVLLKPFDLDQVLAMIVETLRWW